MVFFVIGAPYKNGTVDAVWNDINKHVFSSGLSTIAKGKQINAELNKFKLGNLDSLMYINDILIKHDIAVESLLKKVERQYLDITEKSTVEFPIETKDGIQNIDAYVMGFRWDDSRFPRNTPLAELIKTLFNRTSVVDNDLRQKIQSFQEIKTQAQALQRKEGNLLVKDLVDVLKEPFVKPKGDFIYSDYLTTVVAIVHKNQIAEFLQCYEVLTENVLPRSAKQFQVEDKDSFTVWRIVLMRCPVEREVELEIVDETQHRAKKLSPVEEYIIRARDKLKITVREFEFKPNESREREKQRHELKSKSDNLNNVLKQACEKAFSDVYVTYIHLKLLRVIVDIAMRFGIQDPNLTCIIKAEQGKEKKVQQQLLKLFADPTQMGLYGTKEELEDVEDFFPFVYVPVNIP